MYGSSLDSYVETLHFRDNLPLNRSDSSADRVHFFWHRIFCFLLRAPGAESPAFPAFAEFVRAFSPDAPVTASGPFFCFPVHRTLVHLQIPTALSAAPSRHSLLPVAAARVQG